MSGPMSKKQLFVALLSLLICAPSYAGTTLHGEISAAQEQDASSNGLTDEAISRELELFRGAEISLRQALKIADSLHPGSRIVDVSFDGGSGFSVYRLKTFGQDRLGRYDRRQNRAGWGQCYRVIHEHVEPRESPQFDRHAIGP